MNLTLWNLWKILLKVDKHEIEFGLLESVFECGRVVGCFLNVSASA